MPTYNGTPGLAGTIGLTILDSAGAEHVARSVAGITEPVAGSGAYYVAEHDVTATLTYVWDEGVGTIGASETLYAGRGTPDAIADEVQTRTIARVTLVDTTTVNSDLAAVQAAILAVTGTDLGGDTVTLTITDDLGDEVADCEVWVSSDEAGTVASKHNLTDSLGQVSFLLDDGVDYWCWRSKSDVDFETNPLAFTAEADDPSIS